jgi:hypothetical protein
MRLESGAVVCSIVLHLYRAISQAARLWIHTHTASGSFQSNFMSDFCMDEVAP